MLYLLLQYKQRYTDKDTQDFLAMAALQFVLKVLEGEEETVDNEIHEKIRELIKKTTVKGVETTELLEKERVSAYFSDPLHLNDKGYELIAYAFYLSLIRANNTFEP